MKKAQWIEVHPLVDVVRANVQEETELSNLAGSGSRTVVADANGVLSAP